MKRYILSALTVVLASTAFSQTVFEAVKTSQNDIIGTARYMSVAGAFGALGGDVSAIKDNPAGLGIFRKSELTATVDAQLQITNSLWNNKSDNDDLYSPGMNNLTLVLAGKTWRAESGYAGLVNSNFSFSYNKLRNFNRNIKVKSDAINKTMTDYFGVFAKNTPNDLRWNDTSDFNPDILFNDEGFSWMEVLSSYARLIQPTYNANNEFLGWGPFLLDNVMITPSYLLKESGGINEYSFAWSGNFSNRLYLGASFNLQSINYLSESTYKEEYGNRYGMTLKNSLNLTGNGVNFNVGAIAVPVDFIRVGLSLHTPMFYNMGLTNYADLDYVTYTTDGFTPTPTNTKTFKLQTPLQFNVSTAFILDKRGFLSVEYVFNNYSGMSLMNEENDSHAYDKENEHISDMLQNARTIKIGGEYRLTDNFSLRAGFANTSNLTNSNLTKRFHETSVRTDPEYFSHNSTNYATFGLGYRESNWYVDFAYVNQLINEDYYAYNSEDLLPDFQVTPANIKTSNNNIVATFGIKF